MTNDKFKVPEALLRVHKKELTAKEIVSSELFSKVITGTCQAILNAHNRSMKANVQIDYDESSTFTAATDDVVCVVNAGNKMFITDEQGNRISPEETAARVIGAVFHEMGHILYTCFSETRNMLELYCRGELPVTDIPDSMKDSYNELQELLKDPKKSVVSGNPVSVKEFITGLYKNLSNCIEDGREERLLLENDSRFSGFAAGLKELRKYHRNYCYTWDLSKHSIPVFADLCLLYAKYGCAGTYTGGFEAFENAKPIINEMLETNEARRFHELNSQLILCIWPEIKKLIQEIEAQQEAQQGQQSENQQSGESNSQSGSGSSEAQNNSQPENSKSQNSSSENQNSSNSSSGGDGSPKESNANDVQNALEKIMKDIKKHQQEEKSFQNDAGQTKKKEEQAKKTSTSESSPGEKANLDATINQVMKDLAEQKARDHKEQESCESIKACTRGYQEHNGIDVTTVSPVPNAMPEINYILAEARPSIKKASKEIRRHLEQEMRTGTSKNKMYGKKFHAENLVRRDFRYFENKRTKKDMPKVKVGLLIDESGSMSSELRFQSAKAAALTLYEMFEQIPNLDVSIMGHTAFCGKVELYNYTDFGVKQKNVKERLCNISARHGNIDIVGLTAMAENLLKQDAEERILFIITDGLPHSRVRNISPERELQLAADRYTRKGIDIIVASIGDDQERLRDIYRNQRFLDISKPSELPKKVVQVIKRKM